MRVLCAGAAWAIPRQAWNNFRMLTESNSHVSVCLDITEELPSEFALQRWLAEPIKAATISTSVFLTNKKGYPVLSRPHQDLVKRLFLVRAVGNRQQQSPPQQTRAACGHQLTFPALTHTRTLTRT